MGNDEDQREMDEDVRDYDEAMAALARGDERVYPYEAILEDDLELSTLLDMLKRRVIAEIPRSYIYQPGDYEFLNQYRKRMKYRRVEVSEEQFSRLLQLSRSENIPMRHVVSRAIELYIDNWMQYGYTEEGILRNITPFKD